MGFKDLIREILIFLHFDVTKNLKYDRLSKAIMKRAIQQNHNCIDIGAHKGEMLKLMLQFAPKGKHLAFEPIPYLYKELKEKYKNTVEVLPFALSNTSGETSFNLVKNAPAYSGLKKRRYDIENPEIEEIKVQVKTLDDLIPAEKQIHFIKIDVEGAEYGVLLGASKTLKKNHPVILFECGRGASDFYNTNPIELFNFLNKETGLGIFTLEDFLKGKPKMSSSDFENYYNTNSEYYFVAAAKSL